MPVHTFPAGWAVTGTWPLDTCPYAWVPSITYNEPLGLYMMANWASGLGPDGGWFANPSYFGFWVSRHPWGPWNQVHEKKAWAPLGDAAARPYMPQIAPKWISKDGRSFWMVWTDLQLLEKAAYGQFREKNFKDKLKQGGLSETDWFRFVTMCLKHSPYYVFNAQRVDLIA